MKDVKCHFKDACKNQDTDFCIICDNNLTIIREDYFEEIEKEKEDEENG
jgi:hypothetical protein